MEHLTPIARKEHVCVYCRLVIHKGEKYSRIVCYPRIDNVEQLTTWIGHLACEAAYSKLINDAFRGRPDEDTLELLDISQDDPISDTWSLPNPAAFRIWIQKHKEKTHE